MQLSEILKMLCVFNDRVRQLADRDCSGTSSPLQSHLDLNDDSKLDSTNRAEQEAVPPSLLQIS